MVERAREDAEENLVLRGKTEKKRKFPLADKKALSPVVANLIICATVIAIGISLWSFTYGVTNVLQSDYYGEMKIQIDTIKERFTVEHVAYSNESNILHTWVYNYGDVDIQGDVYVYMEGGFLGKNDTATSVPSKNHVDVTVNLNANVSLGSELVIKVMSRRQNAVYETYIVTTK